MDKRLKLLERIKLQLNGYLYLGEQTKDGWSSSLPFYLFKCPKHGLVESYAKGYDDRLECPKCMKENEVTKVREVLEKKVRLPKR